MPTTAFHPRAAFLMLNLGDYHLHVVLYDLDANGLCLLAPICSIKQGQYYDPACVLENVDHKFFRRRSYVVYDRLMQPRSDHTRKMLAAGEYHPKDAVEEHVFRRIVNGLFTSDDSRDRILSDARRAGLIWQPPLPPPPRNGERPGCN